MAQKIHSTWKVTGRAIKIAHKGFFVTNFAQKVLSFGEAFKTSTLEEKTDEICILAAKQLEHSYPHIDIIGFDIGITSKGDIWIIEGNYVPDLSILSMLKDNSIE